MRISDWSSDVCSSDLAHGRLDIEALADKLVARPRTALLRGLADRTNKVAFAAAEAQFGADAEQSRKRHSFENLPCMPVDPIGQASIRSEEHTSELQSLMRSSYAVC